MPIVIGVVLRTAGKLYYFDPGSEHYERGERVLVETARGLELGCVKLPPHDVSEENITPPLKSVVRRALDDDLQREAFNREREARAMEVCKRLVAKLELAMRLIDAQYTFDGSNVLIHFLADNRVDFRELVRELARELRTRIELRQVGVRDEARLLGGYGICGRGLCCATFLTNFTPVAINTAKEQGLALNPQKISGMCGRLMCCLAYEHECYKIEGKGLPRVNSVVATARGTGKVTKLNVLARQVEVTIPDLPSPVWFPVSELSCPAAGEAVAIPAEADEMEGNGEIAEALEIDGMIETILGSAPVVRGAESSPEAIDSPASPPDERRRPRRRRRKKTPGTASAATDPPSPPPSNEEAAAPKRSRSRRRRPRNPAAAAPTAPMPPANEAPPPAEGQASPRRRRRRR